MNIWFWVYLICTVVSLILFWGCVLRQAAGEEFQLLVPASLFNFFMSIVALFGESNDFPKQAIAVIVLCFYGICILIINIFTGYFTGWYTRMKSRVFAIGALSVMMFTIIFFRVWIAELAVLPILHYPWVKWCSHYFYLLYILLTIIDLVNCLASGIYYAVKGRNERVIRRRAAYIIAGAAFELLGFICFMASNGKIIQFIVIYNTLVIIELFIIVTKNGIYNTVSTATGSFVANLDIALVISDQNERLLTANDAAWKLFPELTVYKSRQMRMNAFYDEYDKPEIEVDGRYYILRIRTLYSGKLYIGRALEARDATEERKYIQLLTEQKIQADRRARMGVLLARRAGHEIRTPLNVIIGSARMAAERTKCEDTRAHLMEISRFSWQLLHRVDMFLDMARVNSGRVSLEKGEYSLRTLLRDIAYMADILLKDKNIEFEMEVDGRVPETLNGNRDFLATILINLLGNAVKYTDEGKVGLRVYPVKSEGKDVTLGFDVTDTGVGIAEADRDRIFREFERIDSDENNDRAGSGIGLSLVLEFVKELKGNISVSGQKGAGSTFTFSVVQEKVSGKTMGVFNCKDEIRIEETENMPGKTAFCTWNNVRALLVDDMLINLEIFETMLAESGIKTDIATGFDEAVWLFKENDYDIVFLDYMLEDGDGIELMKKMRSVKSSPDTKYVMVTADSSSESREKSLNAGSDAFVGKPVSKEKLDEVMISLLPQSKMSYCPNKNTGKKSGNALVRTFVKEVASILEKLPDYAKNGDRDSLRVKVHGIKGACREVGQREFAAYAQKVEDELKSEKSDNLEDVTGIFIEKARKMLEEIPLNDLKTLSKEDMADKPSGDGDLSWINEIIIKAKKYDYEGAHDIFDDHRESSYGEEGRVLEEAYEALEEIEYGRCVKILEDYLSRVKKTEISD